MRIHVGYRIKVSKLWEDDTKEGYDRFKDEEIYDQSVPKLDVQKLVMVVNELPKES